MRALVCEICGGNDLIKKDGVFVCQYCGTKYTLEEAKKLFGEVKIDNSEQIEKLLILARTAYDSNDYVNAEAYYQQTLNLDAGNWEAVFYRYCCEIQTTPFSKLEGCLNGFTGCLDMVFAKMIETVTDPEERHQIADRLFRCGVSAGNSGFIRGMEAVSDNTINALEHNYSAGYIDDDSMESMRLTTLLSGYKCQYVLGDCILKYCPQDNALVKDALDLWNFVLEQQQQETPNFLKHYVYGHQALFEEYSNKLQQHRPPACTVKEPQAATSSIITHDPKNVKPNCYGCLVFIVIMFIFFKIIL